MHRAVLMLPVVLPIGMEAVVRAEDVTVHSKYF